jgi:hypothetical protein
MELTLWQRQGSGEDPISAEDLPALVRGTYKFWFKLTDPFDPMVYDVVYYVGRELSKRDIIHTENGETVVVKGWEFNPNTKELAVIVEVYCPIAGWIVATIIIGALSVLALTGSVFLMKVTRTIEISGLAGFAGPGVLVLLLVVGGVWLFGRKGK